MSIKLFGTFVALLVAVTFVTLFASDWELNWMRPEGRVPAELTANQMKWKDRGPGTYRLITETDCSGCLRVPLSVTSEVTDGKSTSISIETVADPVPLTEREREAALRTIEDAFAQLVKLYKRGVRTIEVEYDKETGAPTRMYIDYSGATHDEYEIRLSVMAPHSA